MARLKISISPENFNPQGDLNFLNLSALRVAKEIATEIAAISKISNH